MRRIWHETDGSFNVEVRHRTDRKRRPFLTRAWFQGDRTPASEAHPTESAAVHAAQRIWSAYVTGQLDAPDAAPETWAELVERFRSRSELSPKTQKSYRLALDLFVRFVGPRSPRHVRKSDVERWLASLKQPDERGRVTTATTRNTYLRTLRACVRWGIEQGWLTADPTEGLTAEKTSGEVRPWLDASLWPRFIKNCQTTASMVRFGLALETGLRKGELLALRWSWIHAVDGWPSIRIAEQDGFKPKWGRARAIPLSEDAQRYIALAENLWRGDVLVLQHDDEPLRDPKWPRDIAKICKRAKLPRVDLHGLRRSAGARWLQDGIPLHVVSKLLGHRDIRTTMRWYGGIADTELVGHIRKLSSPSPKGKD